MEEYQGLLSSLPNDALTHSVSFLSTKDALKLPTLNSSFRQTSSFSVLQDPTPLIKNNTWHGFHGEENNTPLRSVWIPVLFPHVTHSVVLSCKWQNQGFGNRDGTLFVVAVPASEDPNEENLKSIENGTIVYQSPLAPAAEESMQISFAYSPENAYYLWYRVGAGHGLRVKNLSTRTVIYDVTEKWIGRNYETLRTVGFLENHDAFSLDMLSVLASMGQEEENAPTVRPLFAGFLERNGLDMSTASVRALEILATALCEHETVKASHSLLRHHTYDAEGTAVVRATPVRVPLIQRLNQGRNELMNGPALNVNEFDFQHNDALDIMLADIIERRMEHVMSSEDEDQSDDSDTDETGEDESDDSDTDDEEEDDDAFGRMLADIERRMEDVMSSEDEESDDDIDEEGW